MHSDFSLKDTGQFPLVPRVHCMGSKLRLVLSSRRRYVDEVQAAFD